ncbi:MAG TPA: HmuY family protein [Marinobacter sp.]|nr:HmuY family protein [Marinobacter sp.]
MTFFDSRPPAIALLAAMLTACGGGSDKDLVDNHDAASGNSGGAGVADSEIAVRQLPAVSGTAYLNLETGALVGETDDWHIAANRLSFRLNSGASGHGRVGGALAVPQDDFYLAGGAPDANVFINATVNSEEEHLLGRFDEPSNWQEDAFSSAFGASTSWSVYGDGGVISALPDVAYLVRSAEGNSYARMKVVDFSFPTRSGAGIEDFTFEFEVQAPGASGFSATPVSFTPPEDYNGGDACFDFDAGAVVDCATAGTWDVQVGFSGRDWYLKSNSGVSGSGNGGASDAMSWAEADALAGDPGVSQIYTSDATGGVFAEHSWYAYNLSQQHKIWPNFRTFLIKADVNDPQSDVWALQIIGYYDDSGDSGYPSVRWLPVQTTQTQE